MLFINDQTKDNNEMWSSFVHMTKNSENCPIDIVHERIDLSMVALVHLKPGTSARHISTSGNILELEFVFTSKGPMSGGGGLSVIRKRYL